MFEEFGNNENELLNLFQVAGRPGEVQTDGDHARRTVA